MGHVLISLQSSVHTYTGNSRAMLSIKRSESGPWWGGCVEKANCCILLVILMVLIFAESKNVSWKRLRCSSHWAEIAPCRTGHLEEWTWPGKQQASCSSTLLFPCVCMKLTSLPPLFWWMLWWYKMHGFWALVTLIYAYIYLYARTKTRWSR